MNLKRFENKNNKLVEKEEEKNDNKRKKNKEQLLEYKIEYKKKEKVDPEVLKGKDKKVIEFKKRVGNVDVIFKKEQKLLKNKEKTNEDKQILEEKEKENYRTLDIINNREKEMKRTNGYRRFYRRARIHPNDDKDNNNTKNNEEEKSPTKE